MSAGLKIVVNEEEQASIDALMERLCTQAHNIEGALKNIGEALLQTTYDRFDSQTDPQGKKWQPLSNLTKRLRGSVCPILTRTGRLKTSINYEVSGNILRLGPNTVDAAVHQFGATIVPKDKKALRIPIKQGGMFFKKAVIPARPYIGFGEKDQQAAEDALLDWLDVDNEY